MEKTWQESKLEDIHHWLLEVVEQAYKNIEPAKADWSDVKMVKDALVGIEKVQLILNKH